MEKLFELTEEMIKYYKGDAKRIQHFIKVHSFASLIEKIVERVCYLIAHHHTYNNIVGEDY